MSIILQTERLILRDAHESDALMLSRWKDMPLLREMSTGLETEITEENQRGDIKSSALFGNIYLIIVLKEENLPIGYIRINWEGKNHKNAWLCYGMASHYRQGYCYEALREVLGVMYEHDLLFNVTADVYEFNIPSRKLLEKLGFIQSCRAVDNYSYKGRSWDTIEYSMNRERMEMIRTADRLGLR